jgi:hypothetical protein
MNKTMLKTAKRIAMMVRGLGISMSLLSLDYDENSREDDILDQPLIHHFEGREQA